jgi:rubrerythrin
MIMVFIIKKTLENLSKAFIGERQAINRYISVLKLLRERYLQIAEIFLLTVDNEIEHVKWGFE